MTIFSSEGYFDFRTLLTWCDNTWTNAIQPSQEWVAEKLKKSVRTIKRYYAQARTDGFMATLRRWRRTSVITVLGGRHDAQMSLDFGPEPVPIEATQNQQLSEPCPHSVPTVVSSTPERILRKEIPSPLVIFRDLRSRFTATGFAKKMREALEEDAKKLERLDALGLEWS